MFTKQQIEEIALKLKSVSKKDSDFEKISEVNDTDELAILKDRQNRKLSLRGLVNYLNGRIGKPVNYYIVKVNANPSDAVITINGEICNAASFIEGSKVSVVVSKEGYKTETRSFTLNKDIILNISLSKLIIYCNVAVNVFPSDSEVYINDINRTNITVKKGSIIHILVQKDGYKSHDKYYTINTDTIINIELSIIVDTTCTLLVNPTPSDADVYINGIKQKSTVITKGGKVSYQVKKEGYITKEATNIVLYEDTVINVILEPLTYYSFKLYPSPIDNTDIKVTINGEETIINSSSEKEYAEYTFDSENNDITYSVEKEGYNTISKSDTYTEDTIENITLVKQSPKKYNITFNISPENATLKIDGSVFNANSIYTGYIGDKHLIEVIRDNYYPYSGEFTIIGDMTINISLEPIPVLNLQIISTNSLFDPLSVPNSGTTTTLAVLLNEENVTTECEISVDNTMVSLSDSGNYKSCIISENTETTDRQCIITAKYISSDNREVIATYKIVQLGADITYFLNVDKDELNFTYLGGNSNIVISTNVNSWQIS